MHNPNEKDNKLQVDDKIATYPNISNIAHKFL